MEEAHGHVAVAGRRTPWRLAAIREMTARTARAPALSQWSPMGHGGTDDRYVGMQTATIRA